MGNHHIESKNQLQRRYQNCHAIPIFIGTPCLKQDVYAIPMCIGIPCLKQDVYAIPMFIGTPCLKQDLYAILHDWNCLDAI